MTSVRRSPLPGAEMMTFFAPAVMWPFAFSASTNKPVDSMTYSTPIAPHGNFSKPSRLAAMHLILLPLTTSVSAPSVVTSCLNLPCVESYFIWYLKYSASVDMSTTQPWVTEGVCRYFYGKIQQKRAELDSTL